MSCKSLSNKFQCIVYYLSLIYEYYKKLQSTNIESMK